VGINTKRWYLKVRKNTMPTINHNGLTIKIKSQAMMKNTIRLFLAAFFALSIAVWPLSSVSQDNTQMLPGMQQFFDNDGNPLSEGTVTTYVPNTSTLKTTFQDADGNVQNTNPIVLDAAGRAIIFGTGAYRQLVKDKDGNVIWDKTTYVAGSGSGGGGAQTGDGDLVGTIKPWAGLTAPNQYVFAYGQELNRADYPELYTAITQQVNVNCTSTSNVLTGIADTTQIRIGSPIEVSCVSGGTTVLSKTSSSVTVSNPANITLTTLATFFPWGNGDGALTFNVPDLRAITVIGRSNMGGTDRGLIQSTYYGTNPNALGAYGGGQAKTLLTANLPPYTPSGTVTITDPGHTHDVQYAANLFSGGGIAAVQNISSGGSSTGANAATSRTTGITAAFTGTAQGGTSTAFSVIQPSITTNYIIKITPDENSATASGVTSLGGMTGSIACGDGLSCTGNIISMIPLSSTGTGPYIRQIAPTLISEVNIASTTTYSALNFTTAGITSSAQILLDNTSGLTIKNISGSTLTLGTLNSNRFHVGLGLYSNGVSGGDLGPGSGNFTALYQNGIPLKQGINGTLTFYVNEATGSDSNNGLSPATPFKTRQHAVNTIFGLYQMTNSGQVVVQLMGSVFTDGMSIPGPMVGQTSPTQFVIQGDNSINTSTGQPNYDAVTISPTGFQPCLQVNSGGMIQWMYLKCEGPNTYNDLFVVGNNAQVWLGDAQFIGKRTATVNEVGSNGDTHSLIFNSTHTCSGCTFPVTITHTTVGGDTVASIATSLKNQINANITLSTSGLTASCVNGTTTCANGVIYITDFLNKASIQVTSSHTGGSSTDPTIDWVRSFEFGPTFSGNGHTHITGSNGANFTIMSSYAISGGGQTHMNISNGSKVTFNNNGQPDWLNIRAINSPDFEAYLYIASGSQMFYQNISVSGSASTGTKYIVKGSSTLDQGLQTTFLGDEPGVAPGQRGGFAITDTTPASLNLPYIPPGSYSGVATNPLINFFTPDGVGNQGGTIQVQGNGPLLVKSDTLTGTMSFYPNGDGSSNFLVLQNNNPIYQTWFDGTTRLQAGVGATIANIGTVTAHQLYFQTGATNRWGIGTSGGFFSNGLTDKGAGTVNISGLYYINGTQLSFSNLGGSVTCAQLPALTGAITTSAGSCATSYAGILSGALGGTGVANTGRTLTLGGNMSTGGAFTTSGANALTLTTTGPTNVTLPTTGTLVNTAVTSLASLTTLPSLTTIGTTITISGGSGTSPQLNMSGSTLAAFNMQGGSAAFQALASTGSGSVFKATAGNIWFGGGNKIAFGTDGNMHIRTTNEASSTPALSSCGTSPTIVGSDIAGTVTMGTGSPTGCTITFANAYSSAPHCNVTWRGNVLATQNYSISTTAITLNQTGTSSNVVDYICWGATGG
jgi:hypothetical protein